MNNGTQPARTRISSLFHRLKEQNRVGLVAYLTAGDPSPAHTPGLIAALVRGGADLIELGVPFSDPIADGPVIQRGSDRALRAGTRLSTVLDIARTVRKTSDVPLLLFTYLNPIVRYGAAKLAEDAHAAGIDGCLLTDLSVEEADQFTGVMRANGLDTVFLAAPTSTEARRKAVAEHSSGFVYLVSRTGITGEQASVSASVAPLVANMRAITDLPLAVGFGIANADQAAEVAAVADAVAVGSAIVRLIEANADNPALEERLESFARELRGGLERARK